MDKPHAAPKAASPGATASQEVSLADLCVLAGMSVRTVR
jgi:hypothetical protein